MKLITISFVLLLLVIAHRTYTEALLTFEQANSTYNNLIRAIDSNNLHDFKQSFETMDEDNRQQFIDASPILYYSNNNQFFKGETHYPSLLKRSLEKKSYEIATYIVTLRLSNRAPLSQEERNLIINGGTEDLKRLMAQIIPYY